MEELSGKVAVVTGGASGIGLAMGRAFARAGMRVVLADIEAGALDKAMADLPEGTEALAVTCDVSDGAQVDDLRDRAVERFGAVHVVCNNAGVSAGGPIWEHSLDDWQWVMGVNFWGVVHGVRAFTPLMIEQGEGHIVNTASMAGLTSPPFMGIYNVTKHAVVTLSETLFADLELAGAPGVGVSVLCPGWVQTRIHEAGRNRPVTAGAPGLAAGAEAGETSGFSEVVGALIAGGLDPADVAQQVLDAVRTRRFYILTHPEWSSMISGRTDRIVRGDDPDTAMLPT
jgi:NAD(P)-dependent dehydrogenase (short-subunit alcohol dehydrogenase family)